MKTFSILSLATLLISNYAFGSIVPFDLRVEHLQNPIGIGETSPRLSWKVSATGSSESAKQSAYRIVVASSTGNLERGEYDLWDTGKTATSESLLIHYKGLPLAARDECYWKVKLWDANEAEGDWSETSSWSIGLLSHEDWEAKWIAMENDYGFRTRKNVTFLADDPQRGELELRPAKYFRKEFKTKRKVRRAMLYATARGIYEAEINGTRVGDFYLAPGWTDYDQRLYYQSYDVTDLVIKGGTNAIGATLADGWYAGYVGYALLVRLPANPTGRGYYGDSPSLFMQLEIEYEDGKKELVVTDESWKTSLGPITETDILMGEAYDARKELGDWTNARYNDSSWEAVVVRLPYVDAIEPHPGVPVRILERISSKAIYEPEPGVYVFDLGQNFSGIPEIKVKAKRGQEITIRTGEMVRPDKSLLTANLRCARSTNTYIAKGEGVESWHPQLVYHGFQYVELTGLDEKPDLDAVTGLVMHSDTPLVGTFVCSDPMLNQLFSNIVWTQRSNFLEVPTDCPQRDERLGWTGDAQIFVNAATYNADISAFYKKWLIDLRDSQWDYGGYPGFAPRPYSRPGNAHGTAWMDAGVICPWTIWQVYGDLGVVRENWQSMELFMQFRHWRDRRGRGVTEGMPWGDWLNLDQPTPLEYIDLCYYAYSAALMSEMAEALGETRQAQHYRELRERLGESFRKLYLKDGGKLSLETQTAYALAIFMDLIPVEDLESAGKELVKLVEAKGGRMATGFIGTRHLLPALTKSGQHEMAGRLMHTQEYPSWGYEVANGATTIWERWNSYIKGQGASNERMNSFSHYAFGAVGEWMYENYLGIRSLEPGWGRFLVAPKPTELITWAKGSFDSPRGKIEIDWKRNDAGGIELKVVVPANTTAELRLPEGMSLSDGATSQTLDVGTHSFQCIGK